VKPLRYFSLFLVLVMFLVEGCEPQPSTPQEDIVEFALRTALYDGKMVFVGIGDEIEGAFNPDLFVTAGDEVRIVIVNGDGMPHDLAILELSVHSELLSSKGESTQVVFQPGEPGEYVYYCAVAGHRELGMEGKLIVTDP